METASLNPKRTKTKRNRLGDIRLTHLLDPRIPRFIFILVPLNGAVNIWAAGLSDLNSFVFFLTCGVWASPIFQG